MGFMGAVSYTTDEFKNILSRGYTTKEGLGVALGGNCLRKLLEGCGYGYGGVVQTIQSGVKTSEEKVLVLTHLFEDFVKRPSNAQGTIHLVCLLFEAIVEFDNETLKILLPRITKEPLGFVFDTLARKQSVEEGVFNMGFFITSILAASKKSDQDWMRYMVESEGVKLALMLPFIKDKNFHLFLIDQIITYGTASFLDKFLDFEDDALKNACYQRLKMFYDKDEALGVLPNEAYIQEHTPRFWAKLQKQMISEHLSSDIQNRGLPLGKKM